MKVYKQIFLCPYCREALTRDDNEYMMDAESYYCTTCKERRRITRNICFDGNSIYFSVFDFEWYIKNRDGKLECMREWYGEDKNNILVKI